jgi:hypothetical protein
MWSLASRRATGWGLVCLMGLLWPDLSKGEESAVSVEAYRGEPFGVAHVRIDYPTDVWHALSSNSALAVDGETVRPLYPVFVIRESAVNRGRRMGAHYPEGIDVWFLFQNKEAFRVEVWDDWKVHTARIEPEENTRRHGELLKEWWRAKLAETANIRRSESHIPVVDNYVVTMLGRRLGKTVPEMRGPRGGWGDDAILGSLIGTEEVKLAMQKDRLLGSGDTVETPDRPLPKAVLPPAVTIPEFEAPKLETLAKYVPEECFYIRFGSFENYKWYRGAMERWGGDLRELIAVRGLDYGITERLQTQLVLPETVVGDFVGKQSIRDLALIGMDGFVREGAAVGVVFEASNNELLSASLASLRTAAVAKDKSVTEKKVEIAGRQLSLVSSSDNRVRSFYISHENVHLVTTSRAIVERFVQATQGVGTLAGLKEFQYARSQFPADAGDVAFVYLSDPWFRQLVGPKYRAEMTRRMQAENDLELLTLARLAAQGEGKPAETVEQLVTGQFLPPTFTKRPDGSHVVFEGKRAVDSLRGARGTFLPVSDVDVTGMTPSETKAYEEFTTFYQRLYVRMDPVVVAVKRTGLENDRERVVLDVAITPFTKQRLGGAEGFLGPEVMTKLAPIAGDLARLEVQVKEIGYDGMGGLLYGALHDWEVPYFVDGEYVQPTSDFPNTPFYIGASPFKMVESVMKNWKAESEEDGYSRIPRAFGESNVWLRKHEDFLTAAFRKDVLQAVTPELKVVPAERPAQVRLMIGDLGASKMAGLLRAQSYLRTRTTTAANENLMNRLSQQLGVPQEEAKTQAEEILHANLVCPLGGEYRLPKADERDDSNRYMTARKRAWRTDAPLAQQRMDWVRTGDQIPKAYQSRVLNWFHGGEIEVRLKGQTLYSHTELELSTKAAER